MKNHTIFSKIHRAKVGASCALVAAISVTLLTNTVSHSTNSVAALVLGTCLGVLGWLALGQLLPQFETSPENRPGRANWPTAVSKMYVLTVVLSSFSLSYGGYPVIKLMGAAGLGACLGFVLIDALANRK